MEPKDLIKAARKKRKLTQRDLAAAAGMAEITIRNYEGGKYRPKLDSLKKIAEALQVPILELLPLDSMDEADLSILGLKRVIPGAYTGDIKSSLSALHDIQESEALRKRVLYTFEKLNTIGKERAVAYVEDLVGMEKYRGKEE